MGMAGIRYDRQVPVGFRQGGRLVKLFRHPEDCIGCHGEDHPCEFDETILMQGHVAVIADHVTRWATWTSEANRALRRCDRDYDRFCALCRWHICRRGDGADSVGSAKLYREVCLEFPDGDWAPPGEA